MNPTGELTEALQEAQESEVASILKQNPNIISHHCSPPWLHLAIAAPRNQHNLLNLLLDAGAPLEATDKLGATALHVAAGTQQAGCLEELLKRGATVDARDRTRKTAIHYAAHSNSPECISRLLDNGCSRDFADNEGKSPLHIAAREGALAAVIALLLNGTSPMIQDHEHRTPLHLARVPEVAKALVNAGADVTAPDTHGHTPLSNAVDRRPSVVPQLLNSGVAVHGNIHDSKAQMFLNLDILKTFGSAYLGEMSLLNAMSKKGQYNLLKHPLCETFLHLKWLRVYPLFIVKVLVFFSFTVSLTAYVCLNADFPEQCERNVTTLELNQSSAVCYGKICSKYISIFFLVIITLRQIVKLLVLRCRSYSYKGLSIWLEVILTMCTLIVHTTDSSKEQLKGWYHNLSVIAVLLAWLQNTVLMGHIPTIGIYVHLFKKVSFRMLWFGLVFLSLLVGFGVSFHLLFDDASFHPLPTALLKTLAMMVGELDMGNLIGDTDKTAITVTSQLLLLAFILLMTVVTTNLLVGLAVSDITEMQKEAGVQRLALTVEHEEHVDIVLYHPLVIRVLPKKFVKWLRHQFSLLDHIPAYPMPLNMHNPWLSHHDTLKTGNLRGGTMENFNVMIYPNNQRNPGCIYKSSTSSTPILTSYMLPSWIITNIRLLMSSQKEMESVNDQQYNLQKPENKSCQKCKENTHGCDIQDIQKQISDLQSAVTLITELLQSKNQSN